MSAKTISRSEQFNEAVEAGDLVKLQALYQEDTAVNGRYTGSFPITPNVQETSMNAANLNPHELYGHILHRILVFEYSLLERVNDAISTDIAFWDGRGHYPNIPDNVIDVLLPRYSRITGEIFKTIKMLKKLDPPKRKHGKQNAKATEST